MTDNTHVTLLRRMTRLREQGVAENPLTTSRAVRLALTKAANDAVGLALTVSSVGEAAGELDDMLAELPDGLLLIGLYRDEKLTGLMALDMQLRAAVLEMQTMGVLSDQDAADRPPTRTDKSMCDPLVTDFLASFPNAVIGSPVEGWCDGITQGDRVDSTRAAGLVLDDCTYRTVQMTVDLGGGDRQGLLIVALPMTTAPEAEMPVAPPRAEWGGAFQARVEHAPAELTAVLNRFPLSIAAAQSLQIGQVLDLPGCTVHSVRMISADGRDVGAAKLGQSGGMRAVRIEAAPPADLADLTTSVGAAPIPDMMMDEPPALDLSPELSPMDFAVETQLPDNAMPEIDVGGFNEEGDGFPAFETALEDTP